MFLHRVCRVRNIVQSSWFLAYTVDLQSRGPRLRQKRLSELSFITENVRNFIVGTDKVSYTYTLNLIKLAFKERFTYRLQTFARSRMAGKMKFLTFE